MQSNSSLINFNNLSKQFNPVHFIKSNKAKNIRISIDANLKIKVTYPKRINIQKAQTFFESQIIWTQNSLLKLQTKQRVRQENSQNNVQQLSKADFLTKSQYLVKRCQELAQKYQFHIQKITLRSQKSIWGSCSAQNNISLNKNLAFLKDELIDYVILHELVHTKVKNHSNKFWNELKKVLPNAKPLDKELKSYSPNFFNN